MELSDLKGIGKQRKTALEDAGIFTVEDLINYFPYKYYDFSKTEPFADDGRVKIIKATVKSDAKVIKTKQKLSFVTAKMTDEIGCDFNAVWFNQTYVKNLLHTQNVLFLYGKNSSTKKNTFVVSFFKNYDETKTLGAMPVYHIISGLGQKVLRDAINESLENTEFSEIVPNSLLSKYNLMDLKTAYILVHNPENLNEIERAIYRIQIEKLIPLIAINEYNKHFNKVIKKQQYLNTINLENDFKNLLPYKLTTDQSKAIYDIEKDMSSKFAMNRLLQGDVGSGKTVVALFGAYISAKNNYQSAIIAPTEILAEQHYETITKLFAKTGIKTALLTSSVSGAKKNILLEQIKNNEIQIIVGTHSILSDQIKFQNLSYAVIDEQHRFGVKERAKLTQKGVTPDILIMSATPIPRSLSLVLYGDLELTTINSRPKPLNTITNLVSEKKQDDMWNYIREKVNSGEKVYVVCSKD